MLCLDDLGTCLFAYPRTVRYSMLPIVDLVWGAG